MRHLIYSILVIGLSGAGLPVAAQSLIFANGFSSCEPPAALSGSVTSFVTAIGSAWPSYNGAHRVVVPSNNYLSLSFVATATPGQFGTFSGTSYPGDGDGLAVLSISPTPGCFDPAYLPSGCYTGPAALPGISWVNGVSAFSCPLVAGQTYYLNITFGPTTDGASCPGANCGRDFGNIQAIINP